MAWTFSVTGTEYNGEQVRVLVTYTDGINTVYGSHSTNSPASGMDWLKGQIAQKISQLEALSALSASIPVGSFDLTLPPPAAPEAPPLPIIKSTSFSTPDYEFARNGVFGIINAENDCLWMKIEEANLYANGGTMYCGSGFTFGDSAEMCVYDKDQVIPATTASYIPHGPS